MKPLQSIAIIVCGLAALSSCQAVFTYSPLAMLARDPDQLSDDQKVQWASDIINTGSVEELIDAYSEIKALAEAPGALPTTVLLAADLAFASSGIMDVVSDVLADPELISSTTPEELEAVFESLDIETIIEGAAFVQAASTIEGEGAEISDTQYIIAGAALLLSAAEEAGDFSVIENPPEDGDAGYDTYQDAVALLAAGGIADLTDLFSFAGM
jgi:hypothetical protein